MVKCLAQGHKHHGHGRDSNPHSDDSAIRTQIQCTKPRGHDDTEVHRGIFFKALSLPQSISSFLFMLSLKKSPSIQEYLQFSNDQLLVVE